MRKRCFLCLVTAAVLLLTCCSNVDNTSNASTTAPESAEAEETTSQYAEDDLDEYNFDGYTFNIWSRVTNYFHGYLTVEEETADVLEDEIYKRNRYVEERFNFVFNEVTGSDDTAAKNTILAGDNSYDIINTRVPNAYTWAQDGIIHSVNALPYIDLTKPYWHQDLNSELTIANKVFFASGRQYLHKPLRKLLQCSVNYHISEKQHREKTSHPRRLILLLGIVADRCSLRPDIYPLYSSRKKS